MATSPLSSELTLNLTYAERQVYHHDVLKLPNSVDRWLTANAWAPHINFLQDYLMLADVAAEHIVCFVECECNMVRLAAKFHKNQLSTEAELYLDFGG